MSFSRKHFETVASSISRTRMASTIGKKQTPEQVLRLVATDLAATFAAENPRFDRERFMKACGF